MPMSIQYVGFQVQPHGRDYSYHVLDPPSASRRFTFTISHQAFAEKHILYQDAADICYQKLQRELLAETGERPLQPYCTVSDQELDAYRTIYRPTKKHSW
jgi:S-adenosylmethionine:tRNA-ribosyltransferase-isomerase (queuine synthetase)